MALDIKPTRSELINLKRRIKQTSSGYNLLKMKRDGLFFEFRTLLAEMIAAREELVGTYRDALKSIALASSIEGGLAVKSAAIAATSGPEVTPIYYFSQKGYEFNYLRVSRPQYWVSGLKRIIPSVSLSNRH